MAIPTDVSKQDEVKKVIEQAVSQFGKIDILINNAGITIPRKPVVFFPEMKVPLLELPEGTYDKQITMEEWNRIVATNLTSVFHFVQAVGPHMLKQRKGKVINISSVNADLGTPYSSAYCVTKAGLSAFTRCLASEWAPFNINVNAIGPGDTDTNMASGLMVNPETAKSVLEEIPAGRIAEPREIAFLARYLASEASSFMNGQTIFIDGGRLGRGAGL